MLTSETLSQIYADLLRHKKENQGPFALSLVKRFLSSSERI